MSVLNDWVPSTDNLSIGSELQDFDKTQFTPGSPTGSATDILD